MKRYVLSRTVLLALTGAAGLVPAGIEGDQRLRHRVTRIPVNTVDPITGWPIDRALTPVEVPIDAAGDAPVAIVGVSDPASAVLIRSADAAARRRFVEAALHGLGSAEARGGEPS